MLAGFPSLECGARGLCKLIDRVEFSESIVHEGDAVLRAFHILLMALLCWAWVVCNKTARVWVCLLLGFVVRSCATGYECIEERAMIKVLCLGCVEFMFRLLGFV